ncbi:MAG: heme biosynthesis protein HemY [Proteobacteria bacterium]|nr:heme biosynthesis protein HemY [Pseudomonadota bacterium]
MIRALGFLGLLAAVMLVVAWFAERPGDVTIVWQGWRIDTSAGALVIAAAAAAVAAAGILGLWRGLVGAPRKFTRWRRDSRRRRGYVALTQGLVAVAAGDPIEARRQARRADVLLNEPPLTMLLSAQAAQLSGDEPTAKTHYTAMLARPETEFLGVRGLLVQAMKAGDRARATELARRARTLQPKTPWVLTTLFELETAMGEWRDAAITLQSVQRAGALAPAAVKRHQAAVLIELSRQAAERGEPREAVRYAEQAYRAETDHPAAATWLARSYAAAGDQRKAGHLVEQEWARRPHPELLAAYRLARPVAQPLQWVKQVERLARLAPTHRDSLEALGTAALDAGLWGEARRHLTAAVAAAGDRPGAGLCRLMARLEEEEKNDATAMRRWLQQAAEAPADAGWICESCGAAHGRWQANCTRCGAFDRMIWRAPDRAQPALVAVAPEAAPP